MHMQNHWKSTAFDLMSDYSDCLIIRLTADGKINSFNRKAEDIYNWRYKNVVNKNFLKLCEKFGYQLPISDFEPILLGATHQNIVTNLRVATRNEVFIKWTLMLLNDSAEKEPSILMIGIDITSHRCTEDNLSKTVLYLDNIINNIPHFIFWKDINSVFIGCNKKFADSVGMSSKEIINSTDYAMPWSKQQSEIYIKDDQAIMATGIPKLNYEETQRQIDGTENIMLVSKVPIYDRKNNKVTGLLGIYTDITERKQMEAHLLESKEKAELANIAKTEFVRNMEHDIRTPFSGIWGMSNLLWEEETDLDKKSYLGDIARAAKELMDFCNDILDYTKTELNILPVLNKKFDIRKLIDSVISIEKPAASFKKLKLILHIDDKIPSILIGDQYRIQRILINLLSNSLKFTHQGHVKLAVKLLEVSKNSVIVRFYVEDTGVGIPADKIQFIFEKFSRISSTNKGHYKGIGLGLTVVKQFMHEMQGEIDIESIPNKGSTFICTLSFELPLVSDILIDA